MQHQLIISLAVILSVIGIMLFVGHIIQTNKIAKDIKINAEELGRQSSLIQAQAVLIQAIHDRVNPAEDKYKGIYLCSDPPQPGFTENQEYGLTTVIAIDGTEIIKTTDDNGNQVYLDVLTFDWHFKRLR